MFAGVSPQRGDDPLSGGLASYGIYATKDERAIALGALEPKFWLSFCSAVGLDADVMGVMPGAHQTALKEKVAAIFRTRTQAEWIDFARAHDVCLEPVLTPEEASRDPHLEARGMFVDVKSPWGDLRQMRTPITPRDLDHAAPPRQGEHTRIILREAGYDDIAITKLEAEGAAR
jgi:alpha-methylacyl-CoA racemase